MNTMTKCLLAVIVTFLPFMAVAYDPSLGACSTTNPYHYGDTGPDGGIVFYIDGGGCNGMEAQPYDVGANSANSYQGVQLIWSQAIANSAAYNITPITTALSCSTTAPSSPYCWHLPPSSDLNQLYIHRALLGCAATAYWSSTEETNPFVIPRYAWFLGFNYPSSGQDNGYALFTVESVPMGARSIRHF